MNRDIPLVRTMLLAIENIYHHRAGHSSDFTKDRATIYELIVLGEAAKEVSDALKAGYADVPWALISGTRNRLAHDYEDISYAIIHTIVDKHLPELEQHLRVIVNVLEQPHG